MSDTTANFDDLAQPGRLRVSKVEPDSADTSPSDNSSGPEPGPVGEEPPEPPRRRRIARIFSRYIFTSLTQRIIFLNLAALVVLLSGILFLNQFRDGLIEARVESLLTQGEIISGAISARATVETDAITIDPERLLELQAGESTYPADKDSDSLDFPINPEQVAPVLRRLISPTRTRARIYDREGLIILDSNRLYTRGQIFRYELPPISEREDFFERNWLLFRNAFFKADLPLYEEAPDGNGTRYREVVTALTGGPASETRRTDRGDTIVSVAVPVQRFRAVLGVLLLSTEAGDIDEIIRKERIAILRVFGVAATVTILLSILLASTIAKPLQRLSAAAEKVRTRIKSREEIPDFSDRHDEIGDLSTSLRDMTSALYARIEAIESFAADVSHELKNPLTSLRSAVETLPLVKTEEQQHRLLSVIEHDVRRLDRLISDISDASRLDAELAREDAEPVNLAELLQNFHSTYENMASHDTQQNLSVTLKINAPASSGRDAAKNAHWFVAGHKGRLGQVMANLLENARSFVPKENGRIDLELSRMGNFAVISVTDNGPGIPPDNTQRIFERFYTDRPQGEQFGQNSGLGLSITRQIVESHGGAIRADNVEEGIGARFTVTIPLVAHPVG